GMYVPTAQVPDGVTILNVRLLPLVCVVGTAGEPYSLSVPIKNELQRVSGLPVARIRSMGDVVGESTARTRFDMWLMTIFGCSALLLAAVGIYGVMAYSVQQRTKEIGIRLALGADARSVQRMVVFQGMTLALPGVAIGLAAAFGLTRIMAGFLFGVTPRDPLVFMGAPLLLSSVAFIAVWLPGRVACRVDPVVARRAEECGVLARSTVGSCRERCGGARRPLRGPTTSAGVSTRCPWLSAAMNCGALRCTT